MTQTQYTTMRKLFAKFSILVFAISTSVNAQYTDVINSNRPGFSYSAFSVGKNVAQGEFGLLYDKSKHYGLDTKQILFGFDFAVRYGLLFEELEIIWDGAYAFGKFTNEAVIPAATEKRSNFLRHTIGVKYLVFDPFKKYMDEGPNIRSWNANHNFQWKNLIPAISVYAGVNFNLGDNPFYPDDPTISPKVMVATQSHLTPEWVFVTNIMYDKITADDPVLSYILTLTHTLNDPKYSMFVEHQGIKSDTYSDGYIRGGAARLISKDLQVDVSIGTNIKNTPVRVFGGIGVSYRLDNHSDIIKPKTRYKVDLRGKNPFDEEYKALDTLPKKERRRLRKEMRKEGYKSSDSISNPFGLDDTEEEDELSKSEEKRRRKEEVEERKKILDSLNQAFEEKRAIQTQEILEKEEESGGFEDIDESKLSKKQLKDLKKARKERLREEAKALKEEAKMIKEEEKRLLEEEEEKEKRSQEEQDIEEEFFDDINEDDSKKKKKEKRKKTEEEEIEF